MTENQDRHNTIKIDQEEAAATARKLTEQERASYRDYVENASGKRTKRHQGKVAAIIVLAVVIVAAAIFLIARNHYSNDPKGVLRRFEDGFNQLDIEKIAECYPPDRRDIFSDGLDATEEEMKRIRDMIPELSIQLKDIDYNADKTGATVQVDMVMQGGVYEFLGESEPVVDTAEIKFVKLDGRWYLESLSEDPFDIFG